MNVHELHIFKSTDSYLIFQRNIISPSSSDMVATDPWAGLPQDWDLGFAKICNKYCDLLLKYSVFCTDPEIPEIRWEHFIADTITLNKLFSE